MEHGPLADMQRLSALAQRLCDDFEAMPLLTHRDMTPKLVAVVAKMMKSSGENPKDYLPEVQTYKELSVVHAKNAGAKSYLTEEDFKSAWTDLNLEKVPQEEMLKVFKCGAKGEGKLSRDAFISAIQDRCSPQVMHNVILTEINRRVDDIMREVEETDEQLRQLVQKEEDIRSRYETAEEYRQKLEEDLASLKAQLEQQQAEAEKVSIARAVSDRAKEDDFHKLTRSNSELAMALTRSNSDIEKANQEIMVLQEQIDEYKKQLAQESEERQSEKTELQGRLDDVKREMEKAKADAEAYATAREDEIQNLLEIIASKRAELERARADAASDATAKEEETQNLLEIIQSKRTALEKAQQSAESESKA